MPVQMDVKITGAEGWRDRLASAPEAIRGPEKIFLRRSGNLGRKTVRPMIHRRSGKGRRSVRVRLRLALHLARVFSPVFYLRFVDRGTRYIQAQKMFERAATKIQSQVVEYAGDMARAIAAKVQGR